MEQYHEDKYENIYRLDIYSTQFITLFLKARVFNISKKKVSLQCLLSLSSNSKYHRSPPQFKFKSRKCISVVCIFLAEEQDRRWLPLPVLPFRCHIWFSTGWLFLFLRPMSHIHSLSVVICLNVQWCAFAAHALNNAHWWELQGLHCCFV